MAAPPSGPDPRCVLTDIKASLPHVLGAGKDEDFGDEQITALDLAYQGSRFGEVRRALFENPYQRVWGAASEPPLPVHDVTLSSVLKGVIGGAQRHLFRQATARAVDSHADLRWGQGRRGYRRLLHPNGICLTGRWEITAETAYTGHFRRGSRALIVGRYSTCCTETRRGHIRSLSLVGKLFPTTDPDHGGNLRTANFITQQDIGGDYSNYINDAEVLNAPNTTPWRRGVGVGVLLVTGAVFAMVDKQPTIRQLYPVAELGKPEHEPTQAPEYMRLMVASDQPRIEGEALDFRDEVMAQIYDPGDPRPKRKLVFDIEVTDHGQVGNSLRRQFHNWRRIGRITFEEAVVSYNGDFVVHFNHPTWREDRNDPRTATRVDGQKRSRS
jgi:hypothetical protein